jgi:hypothetical protein
MTSNQIDTQNTKPAGNEYIPPHERRRKPLVQDTSVLSAQELHTTNKEALQSVPAATNSTYIDRYDSKGDHPYKTTTPANLEKRTSDRNEPDPSTHINAKAEALHNSSHIALHHEPRAFRNSHIHATSYGRLAATRAVTDEHNAPGTMTEKRKARGTKAQATLKAEDGSESHAKAEALRKAVLRQGSSMRKADADFGRLSPVEEGARLDRQKEDSCEGWIEGMCA